MACVNLLIINGHLLFREALRALFRDRSDIRIVGEVCDFGEAMSAACARTIDIVILDLDVPGLQRIDKIRDLKAMQPSMKILVLSANPDIAAVACAMSAGASGYLLQDDGVDEMVTAIHLVTSGRRYVCPAIAHDMATQVLRADSWLQPQGPAAAVF